MLRVIGCEVQPDASRSKYRPNPATAGPGSTPEGLCLDSTWWERPLAQSCGKDCGGKGSNPVLWPFPTQQSLHCSRLVLTAESRERSDVQPLFMPLLICSIRAKPSTLVPAPSVASGAVPAVQAVDSRVPLSGCALPGAGRGCNVAGNVPGGSCDGACVVHRGQPRGLCPVPCCRAGSVPPASKLLMDVWALCTSRCWQIYPCVNV